MEESKYTWLLDDFTISSSNSNVDQMVEAFSAHSSNNEEWADEPGSANSAPKSTITLFTPQFAQSNIHPYVTLRDGKGTPVYWE